MTVIYEQDKKYPCSQCGIDVPGYVLAKRFSRGNTNRQCSDCNMQPVDHIGECRPWPGDFDLDANVCLKNGKPYMVGNRSCGKYDCVQKKHLIIDAPWQALVAEQFSISYRTGRQRNYFELLSDVRNERESYV